MPIEKTNQEWKSLLSPEQFYILREKGTEMPFTGKYWKLNEEGIYYCAGCNSMLFKSDQKFHSSCGWPSFFDSIDPKKITEIRDFSHGMDRIEVQCANCGGHLGHIFDDGPLPTGKRYCINSDALIFKAVKM